MADIIPGTIAGRVALLEQLIAGDVAAEAAAEPLLVNPDRAELQAELDPLKADINEQNVRKAAVEEINRSVRAKDESAEALTRRAIKYIKFTYTDSSKWERYGVENATTSGKPPEAPISIESCNETATSVEIRIKGGKGATRFQVWQRNEGEPIEAAIIIASDVRPSDRSHVVNNLVTGQRYVFHVTAHNPYGEAGPSNEVLATP